MTLTNIQCAVKIQNETSEQFSTYRGLRQGDALACQLFNIALEKVIRDSKVQTTGTIFNKSTQILAYADDIDIIGRSLAAAKESFIKTE